MPRPCNVCGHPSRDEIDLALVGNVPAARVAAKHGVSSDSVSRHFASHVRPGAAKVQALVRDQVVQKEQHAVDVMAELRGCYARVGLLFDACDRYLRDSDDPSRYDVGPRDADVSVSYWEPGPNGSLIQRKAKLSVLLGRLREGGVEVERAEAKHADPRELVLKTANILQGQLELMAKLMGDLDERPQINVLVAQEWLQVRAEVMVALQPYPEARAAVAARLASLEAA